MTNRRHSRNGPINHSNKISFNTVALLSSSLAKKQKQKSQKLYENASEYFPCFWFSRCASKLYETNERTNLQFLAQRCFMQADLLLPQRIFVNEFLCCESSKCKQMRKSSVLGACSLVVAYCCLKLLLNYLHVDIYASKYRQIHLP